MNKALLFALLGLAAASYSAEIKNLSFQDTAGNFYTNLTVIKIEHDGILFRFGEETRYTRIKFTNLTEEVQLKCGYDAQKLRQTKEAQTARYKLAREIQLTQKANREAIEINTLYFLVAPIKPTDFPKTDKDTTACKEIASELKGIHTAIELGVSYNKFSELLTDTAITVQKAKDLRGTNLPPAFLSRVEECIDAYNDSRSWWNKSIDADYKEMKGASEYLMRKSWAKAAIHLTLCLGVAEGRTNVNDLVINQALGMIQSEKRAYDRGVISEKLCSYPLISLLPEDQILERLKKAVSN